MKPLDYGTSMMMMEKEAKKFCKLKKKDNCAGPWLIKLDNEERETETAIEKGVIDLYIWIRDWSNICWIKQL